MLLGLLTGVISVAFHLSIDFGDGLRHRLIDWVRQDARFGPWLMLAVTLFAVTGSAGLVMRLAPEAAGSGIPHLKAVLLGVRPFRWLRVLLVKFASTLIASTGGLMMGREGPSVHMAGAVGKGLANIWPGKGHLDRSIMIAAGGGAGLTAAFNAPLSGLTFVIEELERRCGSLEFFVAAIACLTADMVCRAVLGQQPTFHLTIFDAPPLELLIAFVPLGILAAIFGSLFTASLLKGQRLMACSLRLKMLWWCLLAVALTATAWFFPGLLGGGQNVVNEVFEGQHLTLQSVGIFFAIRLLLTIASASCGAAGGIFMPILVLGALLGWGVGVTTELWFPELQVDARLFSVVGMAAYFSGVVQAPLTAMVLIIEMTDNYALILPLFIACFTALLIAEWLGSPPIYEALLENDLRKHRLR